MPDPWFSEDSSHLDLPYKDLVELGRGGMGVVFKGTHIYLHRVQAVKVMNVKFSGDRSAKDRFLREIKSIGQLQHPNIVQALDAQETSSGVLYLAMEFVPGCDLKSYTDATGQLSATEASQLIAQAAQGLQHAHNQGFVHRDIKPSNLIRDDRGQLKILDFGLALSKIGMQDQLTHGAMGTLAFMAPEQKENAHKVDIRADVYSLGATFFYLLTRTPPSAIPKSLQELRPDLPLALVVIVERMLDYKPERRFQEPSEVVQALSAFVPRRPVDQSTSLFRPSRRPILNRPRTWAMGGALLLLVFSTLLLWQTFARADAVVTMKDRLSGYCGSIAFLPDGQHALAECGGGEVFVWDLQNRSKDREHSWLHGMERPDKGDGVSGVVGASPNGKYIVSAGLNLAPVGDGPSMIGLELYDQRTFQKIRRLNLFDFVNGTLFAPDNASVLLLGRPLAFSKDGLKLAMVGYQPKSRNLVSVVTMETQDRLKYSVDSEVMSLAFSADGSRLAIGGDDKKVRILAVKSMQVEREISGHVGGVSQVGFSDDNLRIFTASTEDGTIRIFDLEGKETKVIAVETNAGRITCTAFWPGDRVVTGHGDGGVYLWNLATGEGREISDGKRSKATAVAISLDGRQALAAFADLRVCLFRLPVR